MTLSIFTTENLDKNKKKWNVKWFEWENIKFEKFNLFDRIWIAKYKGKGNSLNYPEMQILSCLAILKSNSVNLLWVRLLRGGACIAYVANSFKKVTPATVDRVDSQSQPKCMQRSKICDVE